MIDRLKLDGTMTSDDIDTADVQTVESVFVKDTAIEPLKNIEVQDSSDVQFEEPTIFKKLITLKANKSPGPDSIHPIFNRTATAIGKHLSLLFI